MAKASKTISSEAEKTDSRSFQFFPFEHRGQPLIPTNIFARRMLIIVLVDLAIILVWVILGMLGYMATAGLRPIDSFLNACMIAGGMGPVENMDSSYPHNAAKLFAGFYAIFSGMLILAVFGILAAPVMHRILHRFHLEPVSQDKDED